MESPSILYPGGGTEVAPAPSYDTGLLCLSVIGVFLNVRVDLAAVKHELGFGSRHATGKDIVRAASLCGLKARHLTGQTIERLRSAPRPLMLRTPAGRWLVLNFSHRGSDTLRDPMEPQRRKVPLAEICANWNGEVVLVARRALPSDITEKIELKWFLDAVWKYRAPLAHVLVASLFIQLFALITPLFFQVVIDKVLVHKSISTLNVVAGGLIIVGLFDVTLQYLRSYALFHTASRLDVLLGSQLFSRLLKLPLDYFETRATGQTVARMREIETIRAFLTGQALTSILDVFFTLLFVVFLLSYSLVLSCVVIASIPVYVILGALIRPRLREKTKERFYRGAKNQQFLVESIIGAPTLKSAAVEPLVQQQWEDTLAAYVRTSFQSVMLGSLGQSAIQYVSKLTTVGIVFFGAKAVIAGDMTVGELVAFNMISGQIITPILRLSQFWQDFQQAQVSIERMGDIFNHPTEIREGAPGNLPSHPITGAISFQDVTFRYRPSAPTVLKSISFDIPAGQVVGIVGPSGSGKSTLTKLMQRLYLPEQGRIVVDGYDIATIHPAWLRRQIGVVLQENLLFNRTIHENIALAVPTMPREHVVAVSRLAGADEFIRQLPQGYDSQIEERGTNLSGGQRQRIAIARALATNPRVLIFDEATSALDYESERVVQANMREIVRGRTVIIVAHRLAAVRSCDRIVTVLNGEIVEDGTHDQLLLRNGGLYSHLWSLQAVA